MKKASFLFVCSFVLSYCGPRAHHSQLSEAPDVRNVRGLFGISSALTYEQITQHLNIQLDQIPWTDTYWPLTQKELARPWGGYRKLFDSEVGLISFLNHYAKEVDNPEPSGLLSPAEKYDLVYQYKNNNKLNADAIEKVVLELTPINEKLKSETTVAKRRVAAAEMYRAFQSSELPQSLTMTTSAWSQFFRYSTDPRYRYLGIHENDPDDLDDPSRDVVAEKWGWMGICHGWGAGAGFCLGWAAAVFMEDKPKHSVLAIVGEQQVLFTEGDIRGLLSKAWAVGAPSRAEYFLGRRCNKHIDNPGDAIEANSKGKGYAGTLTREGKILDFTIVNTYQNLQNKGKGVAAVYLIEIDEPRERLFLIEESWQSYRYSYRVAKNYQDLVKFMQTGEGKFAPVQDAEMTGCWDVNPASYHEVLYEQLVVKKQGLVMDRTRTGQVWNQPIFAARFKISPLKKITEVFDIAAPYRASGTEYLAEVEATVDWVGEPGEPLMSYPANFESKYIKSSNYTYTLEFDKDRRLIGGEWGSLSYIPQNSMAPDFIYTFKVGTEPLDILTGSLNDEKRDSSEIIKIIHKCSLTDDIDGYKDVDDQKYAYKRCEL